MTQLLVNFGSNGDILNSTPIAKHLKITNPNEKIIWLTREKYTHCIKNNPFIDEIRTVDEKIFNKVNNVNLTFYYENLIKKSNLKEDINVRFLAPYYMFDKINMLDYSLLQIIKNITSGIKDWSCEFIPNVFLSEEEKQEAKNFIASIDNKNKNILIEYESFSQQSEFSEEYFEELAQIIQNKKYNLIFTGLRLPEYLKKYKLNVFHYTGSFMSNAELYNLCDIFIGVSSGISCLTHSDYCDINKLRIEIVRGQHWSTMEWKHTKNKTIVFSKNNFINTIKNLF